MQKKHLFDRFFASLSQEENGKILEDFKNATKEERRAEVSYAINSLRKMNV